MKKLLTEIRSCTECKAHLPFYPNPIIQASATSKIIIIGQAPGIKVQQTGIPWNDASGKKLREWLGLTEKDFYDPKKIALIPMGFCYPGKGKSGDMPPRSECAPQWHPALFKQIKNVQLIILIGSYAQSYYLSDSAGPTLTDTVKKFSTSAKTLPTDQQTHAVFFPLPHPSPRNRFWFLANKWFEKETLPLLREKVNKLLPH